MKIGSDGGGGTIDKLGCCCSRMSSEQQKGYLGAMTSVQPTNASEWQLYRVLQRANLLQYYDTFIAQGGDDVQQLCEAGEEEFLEIMALVGMASKPLHVRRLQKALQEWVANPAAFQGPVVGSTSPAPGSITASVREQNAMSYQMHSTPVVNAPAWSPQMSSHQPPRNISPVNTGSPLGASPQADIKEIDMNQHSQSPLPTPILVESQINAIAEAADRVAKELPPFEPKELNLKKQINRELQVVMSMSPEDPNRMEELRKYAAIYGRFDSKRKGDKPMSLHEISVNEAAAQLCHHIPALLTRREDLFPLSRQIVRDSGYQYSKGHSRTELFTECRPRKRKRSNDCGILDGEIESAASDPLAVKRPKMEPVFQRHHDNNPKTVKAELSQILREEQMSALDKELTSTKQKQENIRCQIQVAKDADDIALIKKLQGELELVTTHQLHLLAEQSDVIRKQHLYERYQMTKTGCINNSNHDDDGTDSSNLPSSSSSPLNDSRDGDFDFEKNDLFDTARKKVKRNQLIQETLFDEGLRIAQQYGMADFAEELKDLQRQKTPQNGHGKNKGWNNQCERKGESDQGVADGDNDIDNDVDNDIDCSDNDSNNKDAESEISVGEIEKCDSEANNDKENQNCSIVQDSNCVN